MHDNARPHVANEVRDFFEEHVIERVAQSPYSPDLNLLDRFVFRNFESSRRNVEFQNVNEIRAHITQFLNSLSDYKMNKQFQDLGHYCQVVIDHGGDYP